MKAKGKALVEMQSDGWVVNDVFEAIEATSATPRDPDEKRSYHLAVKDGFSSRTDLGRRIYMDRSLQARTDDIAIPLQSLFVDYGLRIKTDRAAFALFDDSTREHATARMMAQETVPLWSEQEEAARWIDAFRDQKYVLRKLESDELVQLLWTMNQREHELAAGLGDHLITFHPLALGEMFD